MLIALVCMRFIIPLVLMLVGGTAEAGTLYVSQRDVLPGTGYGNWSGLTSALNSAFGPGAITVGTGLIGDLSGYSALWIQAPKAGDAGLTPAEQATVMAFLATGRRVVMVGENFSWLDWDNSILATVGGSYGGFLQGSFLLTPVVTHPVTFGILTVSASDDGLANGGTALFSENVVTLWGSQQNAISVLSIGMLDDTSQGGGTAGNKQLKTNLAVWLASTDTTAVPEPGTVVMAGLGLLITVWLRGLSR